MKIEEKINQYLISEGKSKFDKMIDILMDNWSNGVKKRKKLKKLGYSDEEIKFIEMKYRDIIRKHSRGQDKDHNYTNYPENFGGIGKYDHIDNVEGALRKELKKTYGYDQ
jgi:hypothetical protein